MTLSHDELRSLLAASALNALPTDEAEQLERHLKRCSHCRTEMVEFETTTSMLVDPSSQPPPGLWDEIVATIEHSGPEPMPRSLRRVVKRRRWWVQGWAMAAAGAAAAVVVLAVAVANLQGDVNHLQNQAIGNVLPSAVANALSSAGHQVVQLRTAAGVDLARAVLTRDGNAFLVPTSLHGLATTRTYQLWALSQGKPVSLGVLGPSPGISLFRVESGMTALMLTAEPRGGVPSPTTPVIAQGAVSSIA
ncbi:MAG: anti-sigma factor domain-containing protein [Acidimicrobiales bacterium]